MEGGGRGKLVFVQCYFAFCMIRTGASTSNLKTWTHSNPLYRTARRCSLHLLRAKKQLGVRKYASAEVCYQQGHTGQTTQHSPQTRSAHKRIISISHNILERLTDSLVSSALRAHSAITLPSKRSLLKHYESSKETKSTLICEIETEQIRPKRG